MVFFFYYESSNLTLEQVDEMYLDPACKPWKSGSWVPKGYNSRREAAESEKDRMDADAGLGDSRHIEHAGRTGSVDTNGSKDKDSLATAGGA